MSKQEEKILKIIKENPTISQDEIASILNIKRSTVAVHISNLTKQGLIVGKGYIFKDEPYVAGIGASNIDIYAKSNIKIREYYDHPANVFSSVGGVAKNILTNLSKLDVKTKLITAVGDDSNGKTIIDDCKKNDIDISNVIIEKDNATSTFVQIQDKNNDMYLAMCDMSILDCITPKYIRSKKNVLLNSKLVVIDSSLRMDTIEEIINICKNRVPIYIDPISENYALKIKSYVNEFSCIKPNKKELEKLSGIIINNDKTLYSACDKLLSSGLDKIFVSLSKDGILYMDKEGNKIRKKYKKVNVVKNASGAGDACMAALIYGTINNFDYEKIVDYGLAAGFSSILCENTINDELSIKTINKIIKENS